MTKKNSWWEAQTQYQWTIQAWYQRTIETQAQCTVGERSSGRIEKSVSKEEGGRA